MAGKIKRTRMPQSDKVKIEAPLRTFFLRLGATEEQVKKAIFSRNPSMQEWMIRWIGKNTDYNQTKVLTDEMRNRSFFAWMYYKATAETIGGVEI